MNSQSTQQSNVNDDIQSMIDVNTAMYRINQMVLAEGKASRPINTIKAYASKQRDWKVN